MFNLFNFPPEPSHSIPIVARLMILSGFIMEASLIMTLVEYDTKWVSCFGAELGSGAVSYLMKCLREMVFHGIR